MKSSAESAQYVARVRELEDRLLAAGLSRRFARSLFLNAGEATPRLYAPLPLVFAEAVVLLYVPFYLLFGERFGARIDLQQIFLIALAVGAFAFGLVAVRQVVRIKRQLGIDGRWA